MIASAIEEYLKAIPKDSDISIVSEVVCITIIVAFIVGLINLKRGSGNDYVAYTPALLTSLGIFGTFVGIVIGLLDFDVKNIDVSINALLLGLKTAFITSLVGIISSILFKVIQSLGILSPSNNAESIESASPEDILNSINKQGQSIDNLVLAIGGDSDSSVLSQLKLLRSDLNDNQKISSNLIQESVDSLKSIDTLFLGQKEEFKTFEDKLWIKMQDFSDVLSKSATETVIEALKQVITDFNQNLTEQFGENFKQLNEAVKALVVWQDNYKVQIGDMTEQYKLGVTSITETQNSVSEISKEAKVIPETMNDLKQVMEVNQHQLSELSNHLEAFKDIRDKAVEAVPEIRKQIDETVTTIAESVKSASKHYEVLLTESDKYIQEHSTRSNELLDSFVNNTKSGIEVIGEKLNESAKNVEKVIAGGAEDFTNNVNQTNTSLQTTSDHVAKQSEVITTYLKDTVSDLNEHLRDMINSLVENSKDMSSVLKDANISLNKDTMDIRDSVVQTIENMQKRLESSLNDTYSAQTEQMNRVFSNLDESLKDQVGKTGKAVEKQLEINDQALQQELTKTMNMMAQRLGQISGKFTEDYSKLVDEMSKVVNKGY